MSGVPDEAAFLAALDRVSGLHPGLTTLEAGLLASLALGLPGDSRAFARTFGIAHALVLRALAGLEEAGRVVVTAREGRTQRTRYAARGRPVPPDSEILTDSGRAGPNCP